MGRRDERDGQIADITIVAVVCVLCTGAFGMAGRAVSEGLLDESLAGRAVEMAAWFTGVLVSTFWAVGRLR
ncbi:hypothetical protein DMH02_000470 [Streptomyces sp. WAC 00631]|uniref:hypothetical protein n=1 Tax=unclassified Streptomyces TaxID=2593676 RepID=UPI000F77CB9C|nr:MULTISPECIES: hypothetical protein [unclassified Streptomyces]MCC5031777.1 hypothetical protein [Streptomyces sp. WAC 00631]MCC9739914.1 hypothetical protein [Streptomyces sp. MNU89]